MNSSEKHPVIEEIERRKAGDSPQLKLALAIEGGGIRGAVAAGMTCAMTSSEISPLLFDAIYGSSAGGYVGAYYLSDESNMGATIFYEDNKGGEFIDLRQIALRRRPVLSLDHVLGPVMDERKPIDFIKVLESQRLNILATRLSDLGRHIFPLATCVEELKEQLRAGSTIPAVAGQPVEIGDEHYIDAGLNEPMPYKAAIEQGYDAVLLLSTRPDHEAVPGGMDPLRRFVTLALSRQIKIKRQEILEKIAARSQIDEENLAELRQKTSDPDNSPFVYAIHPDKAVPTVRQLEKKWPAIIAGIAAGYLAVKQVFGHSEPSSFQTRSQFRGIY